jgi:hypothetical protein
MYIYIMYTHTYCYIFRSPGLETTPGPIPVSFCSEAVRGYIYLYIQYFKAIPRLTQRRRRRRQAGGGGRAAAGGAGAASHLYSV